MIIIKLPMPPSVNKAFAGKDIRYKSKEYKDWEILADKALREQGAWEIIGDEWLAVEVTIYIDLYCLNGNKRVIDCANFEKTTIDFLAGYVDPLTRKPTMRRQKAYGVPRIPGFQDHKILDNKQRKRQKPEGDDFVVVKIKETEI